MAGPSLTPGSLSCLHALCSAAVQLASQFADLPTLRPSQHSQSEHASSCTWAATAACPGPSCLPAVLLFCQPAEMPSTGTLSSMTGSSGIPSDGGESSAVRSMG